MTGFFLQNTVAASLGLLAGTVYFYFSPAMEPMILLAVALCGFLGAHLPNIQQPTMPSYRMIRRVTWMACFLIPLTFFFYRPIEFVTAWLVAFLFTTAFWAIINRISLYRDFTRSTLGIVLFPLMLTGMVYLVLGKTALLPVFLASSSSYVVFLVIEHFLQNRQLQINTHQTE